MTYADHHHNDRFDRSAFGCAAPPGTQEMLIAANPKTYFVPPDVGYRG